MALKRLKVEDSTIDRLLSTETEIRNIMSLEIVLGYEASIYKRHNC